MNDTFESSYSKCVLGDGYYHGSDREALETRGGNSSWKRGFCVFQTDPASDDRRGELADRRQSGKRTPDWLPVDPHGSAEGQHGI